MELFLEVIKSQKIQLCNRRISEHCVVMGTMDKFHHNRRICRECRKAENHNSYIKRKIPNTQPELNTISG